MAWVMGQANSGTEGGLLRSILLTNMKPRAEREHGRGLIGLEEGPLEGGHTVPN